MARTVRVSDACDIPEAEARHRARPPADEGSEPDAAQSPVGPTEAEHYAGHLRESTSSMLMHAAMAPLLKGIEWPAYQLYRDRLLADSGTPDRPRRDHASRAARPRALLHGPAGRQGDQCRPGQCLWDLCFCLCKSDGGIQAERSRDPGLPAREPAVGARPGQGHRPSRRGVGPIR